LCRNKLTSLCSSLYFLLVFLLIMTSSNQGRFSERSSSRVLRPPGGGSSNIFGCADDDPKPTTKVDVSAADRAPPSDGQQQKSVSASADATATKPTDRESEKNDADVKTKKPAVDDSLSPSQQREILAKRNRVGASGFNPITGEPLVDVQVTGSKR